MALDRERLALLEDDFTETMEGRTRFLVPKSSLTSKVPPKNPAFFNPSAKLNRDLSVIAYRAFTPSISEKTFADSFTGIGARALRVAVEVPEMDQVYANDINGTAIEAAKISARLNSVQDKIIFSTNEVCKFLVSYETKDDKRFGIADLDPFGTPAKYIDCVLRSVLDNGLISITATDTAVLCGIYPQVCMRRYYGKPLNTSYGNEIALRLMISLAALTASRLELAIQPIFAHASMHYLRFYAKVMVSSSQANAVYENLGFVAHCFYCGNRKKLQKEKNNDGWSKPHVCEMCGNNFSIGGQLWTGSIYDKEFVKKMMMAEDSPKDDDHGNRQIRKILDLSMAEMDKVPYYFRADEISSKLKKNPYSVLQVVEKLQSAGFESSKTALNPGAFKSEANLEQILKVLK